MTFSWASTLDKALKLKIRQAKTLAKNNDTEYKLQHPIETKDATRKDYTILTSRITKEHNDNIKKIIDRRQRQIS